MARLFKNRRIKDICQNSGDFIAKEEKEVAKYASGQESFRQFCCHSGSIFKNYFIPHDGNDHKPKILHTHSLAAIVFVLAALKISVTGYLFLIYPNQARMTELITSRVLELTNSDRAAAGLHGLTIDPVLAASAHAKAEDMITNDYFAHHSPDGRKPWDFIDRSDYPYLFVGENLAMNFSSAESAHRALMLSPSHQKNIMNDRYDNVGLAVVSGIINGKATNVLVELFATKRSTYLAISPETGQVNSQQIAPVTTGDTTVLATEKPEEAIPVEKPPTSAEPVTEEITADIVRQPDTIIVEADKGGTAMPEPTVEEKKLARATEVPAAENEDPERAGDTAGGNIEVIKYPEFIMNIENPANKLNVDISPNPELEFNPNTLIHVFTAENNKKLSVATKLITITKYIFMAALALMVLALAINILIRVTVQHKGIIIETLVVIFFIAGLISVKLHFLEYVADKVAVL